jgi:hypothetical protein
VLQPISASQVEKGWARKRGLEQMVLLHLRNHDPMTWTALYIRFDQDGSGKIGPTLGLLARWKHIILKQDEQTTITEAGLERLAYGK